MENGPVRKNSDTEQPAFGRNARVQAAVGFNTPTIVKYSFWRMTHEWKDAVYVCLNYGEAYAPDEIKKKSICINGDIGEILYQL